MQNDAHAGTGVECIAQQVCDYCDPSVPDRSHPPEYAIDGTSNWWQSPPLSRGMKFNEVNLTIDFGQVSTYEAYSNMIFENAWNQTLFWPFNASSQIGNELGL